MCDESLGVLMDHVRGGMGSILVGKNIAIPTVDQHLGLDPIPLEPLWE